MSSRRFATGIPRKTGAGYRRLSNATATVCCVCSTARMSARPGLSWAGAPSDTPDLMRRIAYYGHEIACHSYGHVQVSDLTPMQFRKDTTRAMEAITGATGITPIGYRAPSWSINDSVPWAFEVLAELGFEYDSSIFPIKHDLYGMPTGPRSLFRMQFENGRALYELPASTQRIFAQNLPLGGGGYLRHSPYWYSRWMIRRLNRQGQPVVVYIHPWEIDPEPPEIPGLSALQRFRMYGSTALLEQKLENLLSEFEFTTMVDYIRYVTRNPIGFERREDAPK